MKQFTNSFTLKKEKQENSGNTSGTEKNQREFRGEQEKRGILFRKEEFGHREGDLMIFSEMKLVLAVFVERMTRKVIAVVNQNKTAKEMEMAIHELITSAGQINVLSITFDNGAENVCHQKVREDYSFCFDTFFCDPYCSWQKGSVENANKLLRQYFPRDVSMEDLTQDKVDAVVKKLNNRPRKCLGFKKSSDEFDFCSV